MSTTLENTGNLVEDKADTYETTDKIATEQVLRYFVQRLSHFENEEEQLRFEAEKLHLQFMHLVQQAMEEKGMNKKQLADALQTTKGYISQLFAADRLLNLITLVKLENILDIRFEIGIVKDGK
ncbi:MAG TPA: helix-turn-helix transcriptional regulator [Chitinophagales bacterium]|nr:helix-turn-helix transcriptional regulator [Chitinophagales bacterium]HRK25837.1 helix-turn-helix transcriptional regulator [Chitinophagales bacterium]